MNDEFEFINEQDVAHRRNRQDGYTDFPKPPDADIETDDNDEPDYDHQPLDGIPDDLLGGMADMVTQKNVGQLETERDYDMTEKAEQPDQDTLNELVRNVTELGADEDVLGREKLLKAFENAEEVEKRGSSYAEGFVLAVEKELGIHHDPDAVDRQADTPLSEPSPQDAARDRFLEHKEKYDARLDSVVPWPRDTVDAYHHMAMTYNAYTAGEKIDGMVVSKVDVFLSGVRFYQSNIFETAIIRALRYAGDVIKEHYGDKVEIDQAVADVDKAKETVLRDDVGATDYGDATAVSKEDVRIARQEIKEYGYDYGIDTTRGLDYNSTDNVKIFRPTDIVGRIDVGAGKMLTVPGMRMVEIDGNRALVGPNGKIAHESTRFNTGFGREDVMRIEYRCNALEINSMRTQLSHMAEGRSVSVDSIKADYVRQAKEAYASRIESGMLSEANRLEKQTIPEAKEELRSFREDYAKLEKIELASVRDGVSAPDGLRRSEIASLKEQLNAGIEKLDNRISAMESRVELLRDAHAHIGKTSVEERFSRAATTEEQAVGRAGRIEYVSNETDKRLADVIDAGTELVKTDVELYNAAHPDSAVAYDSGTGELYNRFGVSDAGNFDERYVTAEKVELPEDHADAVGEYISRHFGEDIEKYKEYRPEPDAQDGAVDTDSVNQSTDIADHNKMDGNTAEMQPADAGGSVTTSDKDEFEAKAAVAHDEDTTQLDTVAEDSKSDHPDKGIKLPNDGKDAEYKESLKEVLDSYIDDAEGMVSLEDDVVNSIIDFAKDAGKDDFRESFDILADRLNAAERIAPEQLERITDLAKAIAEISPVPADAIDSFVESIDDSGIADELINEIGTPDITPEMDIPGLGDGQEVSVTIGDTDLVITKEGIHDALTGEESGGFAHDQAASGFLNDTEKVLYESHPQVDVNLQDMEATPQKDTGSLHDEMEEIGAPDVTATEEYAEADAAVDAGTELSGVEGVEAAGGAEAAEGAIEAASAAALL